VYFIFHTGTTVVLMVNKFGDQASIIPLM